MLKIWKFLTINAVYQNYLSAILIKNSQINTLWLINWIQNSRLSINLITAKFAKSEIILIVIIIVVGRYDNNKSLYFWLANYTLLLLKCFLYNDIFSKKYHKINTVKWLDCWKIWQKWALWAKNNDITLRTVIIISTKISVTPRPTTRMNEKSHDR